MKEARAWQLAVDARNPAQLEVYHWARRPPEVESVSFTRENLRQNPQQVPPAECDVIVVGGGPAGSTAATLLARRGWSVVLFEKHRHPRFHVGESLLPMNLPILERLGVLDEVARIGVCKRGADFPAATAEGYNVFRFERALGDSFTHAYQVRRDEFDALLFRNAAAAGARTVEGHRVAQVDLEAETVVVRGESDDGVHFSCRGRYLVDASGRDTLLGNQLRTRLKSPSHQSAAIFAHFTGVERRPGDDAGNISIYRFDHGWVWIIPLRDAITSVGMVCWPDYLKQRRATQQQFLLDTLHSIPVLQQRMASAEVAGNLHVTGNYSYACRRMCGRRWIMAGDSFAFVDPIFSSGVYLAMHAAEQATAVVDGALRSPSRERRLQRGFERNVRRGLDTLSWFIQRFTTPAMRRLFADPRNVLGVEQAMISMLAGDVYRDNGVRWRLAVFKALYRIASIGSIREQLQSRRLRRRQARALFSGGTTSQDNG